MEKTKQRHEAYKWWSSLTMNEQENYRMKHPFFGKMDKSYFSLHKTSIVELYEHLISNS